VLLGGGLRSGAVGVAQRSGPPRCGVGGWALGSSSRAAYRGSAGARRRSEGPICRASTASRKRLRSREEENRKQKKLLAESILDQSAPKGLLKKKMVGPVAKREAVAYLRNVPQMSERADRKMVRYRSRRPRDVELRTRLRPTTSVRLSKAVRSLREKGKAIGHKPNLSDLSRGGVTTPVHRAEGRNIGRGSNRRWMKVQWQVSRSRSRRQRHGLLNWSNNLPGIEAKCHTQLPCLLRAFSHVR
jgi:hypothetical protein